MRRLIFSPKSVPGFSAASLVVLMIVLAMASMSNAQITGTLTGTVSDQTGAVTPQAQVTLLNQASNDKRDTTSNNVGYFSFAGVLPGTYTVTVTVPGFKTWQRAEIVMNPGDTRTLSDIRLAVGTPMERVEVEATAGEVNPVDSGERAAVLTAKDIDQLALVSRNLSELLKILPGVTTAPNNLANGAPINFLNVGAQGSAVGNGLAPNGVPNRGGTSITSDGANIIDPGCNCWSIATMNPDMIQEVKVQTSNFGADNAKGPVVINNISKSGGSTYHGTAYLYARHNVLNANDWQDNHSNTPKGPDHYYYPGGNFGGPIPFTHKKAFFFFGYEHFLQNTGNAGALTSAIPTASMLAGDFTPTNADNQAACPNGFSSTATDWCNNLAGTVLPNGFVVPDNGAAGFKIPAQFLDPGSAALAKIFPQPNADPNTTGGFNYKQTFPSIHNGYIYRTRVDYNFSDNTKLFVSWQYGSDSQLAQGTGAHMWWVPGNAIAFPGGGIQSPAFSKTLTGHFLHVFSPTMTNEFIATWGWGNSPLTANVKAVNRNTLGYPYPTIFGNAVTMIPSFECGYCGPRQLPDFSQADVFERGGAFTVRKEMPSFADNLTYVFRTHTFKVGAYFERTGNFQGNYFFPNGDINNWGGQNPDILTGNLIGSANNKVANFVMGVASVYQEDNKLPFNDIAYKTISGYIDDSWKVTRRFTLNLGVRFDHISHWYDRNGNGVAAFFPNLVNSDFASGKLYPGLRWHAIDPSVSLSGEPDKAVYVSPRIGMAWDIYGTGKTVVRGGFGAYRWNDQYNDFANALGPGQGHVNYRLPGGFNTLLSQIGSLTPPQATWSPTAVDALDPTDSNIPVTYSYNLTLSQQLPGRSLLEIAYVGNQTSHVLMGGGSGSGVTTSSSFDFIDQNKTPRGALFGPDPLTGVTAPNPEDVTHTIAGGTLPNTYSDYHPFGVYLGSGPLHGQPIYADQQIRVPKHVGYSNYNALQTSWIKQTGRLSFNLNYTWSRAMGTNLNIDPFSVGGNYGVLAIDRPHVINTSYAYNLPDFTHGSRLLGGVTNGWTISGVTTWQAGGNLQANNNANGPNFGLALQYLNSPSTISNALSAKTYYGTDAHIAIMPDLTCDPGAGLGDNQQAKLSCFIAPPIGQEGVRNFPYLHTASFFNSDLSVYKTFHVRENHAVQFRISAFNFLNHPLMQFSDGNQLALPFLADYNTGAITLNQVQVNNNTKNWGSLNFKSGYPSQRIMELAVKYTF